MLHTQFTDRWSISHQAQQGGKQDLIKNLGLANVFDYFFAASS